MGAPITYDPAKRKATWMSRGLDFEDATLVFEGLTAEIEDARHAAWFATFSACEKPMNVNKPASRRTSGSDLKRVDAHVVQPNEYEELPELTEDMLSRAVFKKAGRPRSVNPKQMISLRLAPEVIDKWKATGPGWQTRMAKRLERMPLPAGASET